MQQISFEDFKEQGGNPMAGVAAEETRYYRLGEDLGVIGEYENKIMAHVLRPAAAFDGQYRVDGSSSFSGGSAEEKAEDWLKNR